jgi:hypothetical protein
MATRFYLTSAMMSLTPSTDAGWESAATTRRALSTTRLNTPFESVTASESSTSTTFDAMIVQFVSQPLAAQTITGNVKGIIRAMESVTDADFRAQLSIRIVAFDNSAFRGTLLAQDASALSNEWAAALTNRKFPLNWAGSGAALSSVAAQEGDRLVVEIGFRSHNALAAPRVGTLELGDSSASDLAEDETSTVQNNPWIEFSNTVTLSNSLSNRHGSGTFLVTEMGASGIPQGHAGSYALLSGTFESQQSNVIRVAHYKPMTKESGQTLLRRHTGAGFYGVEAAVLEGQRSNTLRSPIGGGGFPSGSGAVEKFKMRALASPGPGYVTWVVSDTPDFAGAQAPAAIQGGTVVVSDYWTEI